jgi:hypothetical protein
MTAGFIAWVGLALASTLCMSKYANTPGLQKEPPPAWPTKTSLPLSPSDLTLLMFVHPQCPCSVSSLRELEIAMARTQRRLHAHVVFLTPSNMSSDWTKTSAWDQATAIPGVIVHSDIHGVEAQRFHSATSGDTLVYAPEWDTSVSRRNHDGQRP